MHKSFPKDVLIFWIQNMKDYVEQHASAEGFIDCACSCSGSGVWAKVMEFLIEYWQDEFGLDQNK